MNESNEKSEIKLIELASCKSLNESETYGGFSGYANNFNVLDSYDNITLPGCFKVSLSFLIEAGFGAVDHRWGIGILKAAYKHGTGLFVKVSYHSDPGVVMLW